MILTLLTLSLALQTAPSGAGSSTNSRPVAVAWNTGGYRFLREPLFLSSKPAMSGKVVVEVRLSPDGTVTSIRALEGPEPLRTVVKESSSDWKLAMEPTPPNPLKISFYFAQAPNSKAEGTSPTPPGPPLGQAVAGLRILAGNSSIRSALETQPELREGVVLSPETWKAATVAVRRVDPSLVLALSTDSTGKPIWRVEPAKDLQTANQFFGRPINDTQIDCPEPLRTRISDALHLQAGMILTDATAKSLSSTLEGLHLQLRTALTMDSKGHVNIRIFQARR